MAISWAWLYQSKFQLISIAIPGFRPAKLKVIPSSAHKQHLRQEEYGLNGRMRQKEKEGFTKMKARTGDHLEKTISEPISKAWFLQKHRFVTYCMACQPNQDFSRTITTVPSEKRVMPTCTSLAGA